MVSACDLERAVSSPRDGWSVRLGRRLVTQGAPPNHKHTHTSARGHILLLSLPAIASCSLLERSRPRWSEEARGHGTLLAPRSADSGRVLNEGRCGHAEVWVEDTDPAAVCREPSVELASLSDGLQHCPFQSHRDNRCSTHHGHCSPLGSRCCTCHFLLKHCGWRR